MALSVNMASVSMIRHRQRPAVKAVPHRAGPFPFGSPTTIPSRRSAPALRAVEPASNEYGTNVNPNQPYDPSPKSHIGGLSESGFGLGSNPDSFPKDSSLSSDVGSFNRNLERSGSGGDSGNKGGSWPPRNYGRGFGFGSSPESSGGFPAWAVPPLLAVAIIPIVGYRKNQREIEEARQKEEAEKRLKQERQERSLKDRVKRAMPRAVGVTLGAGLTWGLVKKFGGSGAGQGRSLRDIGGGTWWPRDKKTNVPDVKVGDLSPEGAGKV